MAPVVKQRAPNAYASEFVTELVSIAIGNSELVVFCKHGNDYLDHGLRRGVRYEASVYDPALRVLGADAPRFYGSFSGAHGSTLVVEFLQGASRVHEAGTAKTAIVDAAARLGALHARGESLVDRPSLSFLNRYDGEQLRSWLSRVGGLAKLPALSALLGPLVSDGTRIAGALAAARPTVIHGELYPSNVLLEAERIAFVDWETAGVGPGEIDLAALTAGDWGEEIRRACESAYSRSRWPSGPPREYEATLAAARVHVLMRLAAHWRRDPDRLASESWLAEEIAEAADRLGGR